MNIELNSLVINGEDTFDFIKEILNYTSINDLEFRNCDFLTEDIIKLIQFKEYQRTSFIECTFEKESLIKNIKTKSLSIINSEIINYDFIYEMNYLENLTIINGIIEINKINNFKNLTYLRISQSTIYNIENINLDKLKYLFIDNTNINELSFILKLPNLKILSISEEQKLNNQEFINNLKNPPEIIIDSIIFEDGEIYE